MRPCCPRRRHPIEARRKQGAPLIRKYAGNMKSMEARSNDRGQTWSVKLYDTGRLTEYTGGTLAEVDALAAKHGMKLSHT